MKFLLLLAVLTAACASSATPAAEKRESPLAGVDWTLAALGGKAPEGAGGKPIVLRFDSDRVQGHAGCNRFSGTYRRDGDVLELGPLLATKMACPALDLERRFLQALERASRIRLGAGTLELLDGSGTVLARFASPAAAP